jgi:hypothetical protein
MFNKVKSMLKEPAFWLLSVTLVIGVLAFSKLRRPLEAAAKKIPGNDVGA